MDSAETSMRPLAEMVGQHLGYSEWVRITQAQINLFADATNDHQWIHTDPVQAAGSRFGSVIVPGYLILALTPSLLSQIISLRTNGHSVDLMSGRSTELISVNRGCQRVRFLAPVPVDSEIRAGGVLDSAARSRGANDLTFTVTYEVKGTRVPACVAQVIVRNYVGPEEPAPADPAGEPTR